MTLLHAVILGILQGLTEFLPVSSSGHLLLMQEIFGIRQNSILFEVVLHIGTLVPVVIVFWKDIIKLIKRPFQNFTFMIIIGTIPAVIAALLLGDKVDDLLRNIEYLPFFFIVTGVILLIADKQPSGHKQEKEITWPDALFIGCVQAIAITPGISRSGSTISASLFRKINKKTAALYSFMLSIPAILGALVLQIKDIVTGDIIVRDISFLNLGVGFICAMLSGYVAINYMLKLIHSKKLSYFSIYLFALAIFILLDKNVLHILL